MILYALVEESLHDLLNRCRFITSIRDRVIGAHAYQATHTTDGCATPLPRPETILRGPKERN